MKKLLLGLVLSLVISTTISAHHLDPLGWCQFTGGKAVFATGGFSNNVDVEVRYDLTGVGNTGVNWVAGPSFTTNNTGSTLYVFSIAQANIIDKTTVQFRYKAHTSTTWGSWSGNYITTSSIYSGCSALPVKFVSVEAILVKEYQ